MRAALLVLALLWGGASAAADIPGVKTAGLKASALGELEMLLKEGPCPCDRTAQTNMLQCIQAKSCPSATVLGAFAADRFREGLGINEVREALIQKYMDDHVTFEFDLQKTPWKGAAKPKVVIVEFADFECPHCAAMGPVLGGVVKAYPKKVRLYFKQFPLQHHPLAEVAARATLAAHLQGRFWEMHDIVFRNQMRLTDKSFKQFAAELGLNMARFAADMTSAPILQQIQADLKEGSEAVRSTPTLFFNGKYYHGEKSAEAIKAHVDRLLKGS